RERADRADLSHVAGERTAVRLVLERRDHGLRAAVDRDELAVLRDAVREARAAVAEDAALAVERDQRRDRDRLLERPLRERHPRVPGAVPERQVLQRALAALVADRAVERVVDEDELERRVLALGGVRRAPRGADDHAVLRGQGAARLQLWNPLHLDEAHAAGAVRDLHRALVDRHRDELRRAHAGTSATGLCVCIATGASTWSSDEAPPNGQPPWSMCAWNSSRNFAT